MDSTAFTELSTLASPLDHVFRHVPKAHEKALRQAVYNVIAAATLGGICFAAYYVLVVLEPFVMPMFWALMTGFVIHPYKTQLVETLRSHLQWLGESENPASLMLLSSSVTAMDKSFDFIGGGIWSSWRLILLLVFGLVSSYYIVAVIAFQPLIESIKFWITPATTMIHCFQNIQITHVVLTIIGYLSLVFFFWSQDKTLLFQVFSTIIWLFLVGFALNTKWAPFIYGFLAIAIYMRFWRVGGKAESASTSDSEPSTPDTDTAGPEKANNKFRKAVFSILKSLQHPQSNLTENKEPDTQSVVNEVYPDNMSEKHVKPGTIDEEIDGSSVEYENTEESRCDKFDDKWIDDDSSKTEPEILENIKPSEIISQVLENEYLNKDADDDLENNDNIPNENKTKVQTDASNLQNKAEVGITKQEEAKIVHPGVSALRRQHMGSKPAPSFPQNISHLHGPSDAGRGYSSMATPHLYTSTPGVRTSTSKAGGLRTTRFAERARTTIIRRRSSNTIGPGSNGKEDEDNESTFYLKWVFSSCILLQLWFHPILLELLPIPVLYCIIKWVFSKFDLLDPLSVWFVDRKKGISEWAQIHGDALVPRPVRCIWRELYKVEKKMLRRAPAYTDVIVTVLLIVACNTFAVILIFYVTFQLYTESVVLVQLSSTVMSKITHTSFFQQINETIVGKCVDSGVEVCAYVLPGNNYTSSVDGLVESAYQYGKTYISHAISSFLRDSSDSNQQDAQLDKFEHQVLELWDRIYQYWLNKDNQLETKNQDDNLKDVVNGPTVTSDAITSSMENLFSGMLNASVPTRVFNASMFSQFALNNIGTLTSVVDQGWALIKGNIGLVVTIVTECLRILMTGGSGMVNFCLSLVVYFTALFYLLRSQDPIYKPIEVISNHGQLLGSGFASALEKAINGVFTLTVKMVCFYGMWTYLTHKLFAVSLVTLPVLVAAFLAAVPVAGQYCVAIPAALELWLAEGRWFAAILIFLAHMIPTYVVDAAIYSETRQDIHPWITGLSIIGGVYWCGVPGAIYGPLLLCAVYVILSMYTSLLKEIPLESNTLQRTERKSKMGQSLLCGAGVRTAQTPILKRSDSVF